MIIWITGLSGSGKSSLAKALVKILRSNGKNVIMLDGDELREIFDKDQINEEYYSKEGRLNRARKYSLLCSVLNKQGVNVVIATISLFKEIHKWNRENLKDYFEVYLKIPIDELRRRDSKGIYHRFDTGKIKNVVGLDFPMDEPEKADWVVDFKKQKNVNELANELIDILKKNETK